MTDESITKLLEKAFTARQPLLDPRHQSALRLFNGFSEGCPNLVVELFASSVVIYDHTDPPDEGSPFIVEVKEFLQGYFPWLRAGILKTRHSKRIEEKRGHLYFGDAADRKIKENGVWYAIDLMMNQDASLYLDTRNLRQWATVHLRGKTVLNTFAYTGSLGVAAQAGGAGRVVQLDRNRRFLNLAKTSYTLNGFPIRKDEFISADFFQQAGKYKRQGQGFDCVFIDPPLFSASSGGVIDQVRDSSRLINKVRPLINDGGTLVAINNALYVSGKDYMQTLEALCADGYMRIVELIPVPEDSTGYPGTRQGAPITDPSPFNHSTKIAVLEIKHKSSH